MEFLEKGKSYRIEEILTYLPNIKKYYKNKEINILLRGYFEGKEDYQHETLDGTKIRGISIDQDLLTIKGNKENIELPHLVSCSYGRFNDNGFEMPNFFIAYNDRLMFKFIYLTGIEKLVGHLFIDQKNQAK